MANLLLNIVLWVVLGGFLTFCILYAWLARPWRDHMGRHILVFETGFLIAFAYAASSRYIPEPQRTIGWIITLSVIAVLIWWRVIILVKYQLTARRLADASEQSSDDVDA
jgi:hypothetical protein